MKVLLAGGAGFLGSHLAEKFVEKNYEIHVLDNFASGLKENISNILECITLIQQDVVSFQTKENYDEWVFVQARSTNSGSRYH